jgi:predicted PurR-regulated permease PerM
MIVVATWPVLLALERGLRGRRTLAITVMTLLMLLVFVLPFWIAISTLADYSDEVGSWTKSLQHVTIPPPPAFVEGIPVVGAKVAAAWRDMASEGWGGLVAKLQPYVVRVLGLAPRRAASGCWSCKSC